MGGDPRLDEYTDMHWTRRLRPRGFAAVDRVLHEDAAAGAVGKEESLAVRAASAAFGVGVVARVARTDMRWGPKSGSVARFILGCFFFPFFFSPSSVRQPREIQGRAHAC